MSYSSILLFPDSSCPSSTQSTQPCCAWQITKWGGFLEVGFSPRQSLLGVIPGILSHHASYHPIKAIYRKYIVPMHETKLEHGVVSTISLLGIQSPAQEPQSIQMVWLWQHCDKFTVLSTKLLLLAFCVAPHLLNFDPMAVHHCACYFIEHATCSHAGWRFPSLWYRNSRRCYDRHWRNVVQHTSTK